MFWTQCSYFYPEFKTRAVLNLSWFLPHRFGDKIMKLCNFVYQLPMHTDLVKTSRAGLISSTHAEEYIMRSHYGIFHFNFKTLLNVSMSDPTSSNASGCWIKHIGTV